MNDIKREKSKTKSLKNMKYTNKTRRVKKTSLSKLIVKLKKNRKNRKFHGGEIPKTSVNSPIIKEKIPDALKQFYNKKTSPETKEYTKPKPREILSNAADTGYTTAHLIAVIETSAQLSAESLTSIGVPLGGTLFLISRILKQYRLKGELIELLQDVYEILEGCALLNNLVERIEKEIYSSDSKKNIKISENFKEKIKIKLIIFYELLKKLELPKTENNTDTKKFSDIIKSKISSFGTRITPNLRRYFFSEHYMNRIFKEMTVINSLFILMNSQCDWLLRSISSNKNLMSKILNSQEFKDFMNDSSTLDRLNVNPETQNEVEKVIENNPELTEKMNELDVIDAETDIDSDSDNDISDNSKLNYNSNYNSPYDQTMSVQKNNPYTNPNYNPSTSSSSSSSNTSCIIS
jgi:hypothetical protein